ncbi:MAG TPA: hypothetical protein VH085_05160, partial [Nocardioides sp.]|nr:hypothetical protein [Nocardioides sp.]
MTVADQPALAGDVWDDLTEKARRRRLLFDVGTAALFMLLVGAVQLALAPASAVAAVLLGVALGVRRLSIPAMVLAAVAASVAQLVTSQLALVADLAYVPLFFTLGAHRSQAVRRLGLACLLTAVVVAGVWTSAHGIGGVPSTP